MEFENQAIRICFPNSKMHMYIDLKTSELTRYYLISFYHIIYKNTAEIKYW